MARGCLIRLDRCAYPASFQSRLTRIGSERPISNDILLGRSLLPLYWVVAPCIERPLVHAAPPSFSTLTLARFCSAVSSTARARFDLIANPQAVDRLADSTQAPFSVCAARVGRPAADETATDSHRCCLLRLSVRSLSLQIQEEFGAATVSRDAGILFTYLLMIRLTNDATTDLEPAKRLLMSSCCQKSLRHQEMRTR